LAVAGELAGEPTARRRRAQSAAAAAFFSSCQPPFDLDQMAQIDPAASQSDHVPVNPR
jgi:hypothetical protein